MEQYDEHWVSVLFDKDIAEADKAGGAPSMKSVPLVYLRPADKTSLQRAVGEPGEAGPLPAVRMTHDLSSKEGLDTAAQAYGYTNARHLATNIRASKYTPFEMLQHAAKAETEPPPIEWHVSNLSQESRGVVDSVVRAYANLHPGLSNLVQKISVVANDNHPEWMAQTGIDLKGHVWMELNPDYLPGGVHYDRALKVYRFQPGQDREFLATTFEHEITHVAQYWAEMKGKQGILKSPSMGTKFWPEADVSTAEAQAEARQNALQGFFRGHEMMRAAVSRVPEDVQTAVLQQYVSEQRAALKPRVLRKYNQLGGQHTVQYFMRKPPEFNLDDLDLFDQDSRTQPVDAMVAPDELLDPTTKALIGKMNKAGLKGPWPGIRLPQNVSDNPAHVYFIGRVLEHRREMITWVDKMNDTASKVFKSNNITKANYDEFFELVEGLRRNYETGKLIQTLTDIDGKPINEELNKGAMEFRENVTDPAFEYIHGIDRRAPSILAANNLKDTPEQWKRIKLLQVGARSAVKNPTVDEFVAARELEGMLNFDESHDLRGEFVDGYITHQPIANERAVLLDQIEQIDKLQAFGGPPDQAGQAQRADYIKRLTQIELDLAKAKLKRMPARDTLPKKKFFGPLHIRENAPDVIVDKNLPHIAGRYINGIASKRFLDQAMHEFTKVGKALSASAPSVRDYDINYLNNLAGVRGFREDIVGVNFLNDVAEKLGMKGRVSLRDYRSAGRAAMGLTTYFKLLATPFRLPAIMITHFGMTTLPIAGPMDATTGMAEFFSHPKQTTLELMSRGILARDPDFLGAMDEARPSAMSAPFKLAAYGTKYTDAFRKGASWETFRLQYLKPGFKPSPLAKLFLKEVPGRSVIESSKQYADVMTGVTQFIQGQEAKPQAFVGGVLRRQAGMLKQWPINYAALFANVAKTKDPKVIARMIGVLLFFGGMTVVPGYKFLRSELIKHGIILPDKTGYQQIMNFLGFDSGLSDVDITSLRNPVGIPDDPDFVLPWLAGPAVGTAYDFTKTWLNEDGDTGKKIRASISAISPEVGALVDAAEEWRQGGVKAPMGQLLARRPMSSVIVRGMDLSPSIKSQRFQYRNDILHAYEHGHPETATELMKQARSKGIIFGPKDMRQIRSSAKSFHKKAALPWASQIR